MQLPLATYKELDEIFEFDCNPIEKYKTIKKAEEQIEEWGQSNLLIPKDDLSEWFRLAVEALMRKKRTVIMTMFNPHYQYWFKYVWPYAAKMIIYTKHVIMFKGYEKPCPKTMVLLLFEPQIRTTARTNLIQSYVDNKYPYFRLPLKVKKEETENK